MSENVGKVFNLNGGGGSRVVSSFNGRSGAVVSQNGDYTPDQVGAVPATRSVNGKPLSEDVTLTASDVGAAASGHTHSGYADSGHTHTAADIGAVPTGRTVNGKPLSEDVSLSAEDVGAVPTTRTVNGKALSANISLTAANVGAVPTSRKVNGKALSADISLTASDVGAAASGHTHSGYAASGHTHTAADVGALPITGGTLSGDLTLKGSGNFGTKINLGDGDYVHIAEPTDDCLEIKAKKINFVTSATTSDKFTLNGEAIGGGSGLLLRQIVPLGSNKEATCTLELSKYYLIVALNMDAPSPVRVFRLDQMDTKEYIITASYEIISNMLTIKYKLSIFGGSSSTNLLISNRYPSLCTVVIFELT